VSREAAVAFFAEATRQREDLQMARKKVSTTVYLTKYQDVALRYLSDRTKVPAAEYIRQGIDKVLFQELPAGVPGLEPDGPSDPEEVLA
jgi:hypothetical protein